MFWLHGAFFFDAGLLQRLPGATNGDEGGGDPTDSMGISMGIPMGWLRIPVTRPARWCPSSLAKLVYKSHNYGLWQI